jgi:ubiquitin carboxyl-terminal hydrolase 5/13
MYKMADGLWSGRYSIPSTTKESNQQNTATDNDQQRGQYGIPPFMFKALIGKEHQEFSSMRQQVILLSLVLALIL